MTVEAGEGFHLHGAWKWKMSKEVKTPQVQLSVHKSTVKYTHIVYFY